jgi:heme/copper-type cytochrome/quinol oxidase subunit 3
MTNLDPWWARGGHDRRERSFKMSAAQLGMVLLLVSLSVVFIASLAAYLITRTQNEAWLSPSSRGLPAGLVASTALIASTSVAIQLGLNRVRQNRIESLIRYFRTAAVLAIAFLVLQTLNWIEVRDSEAGSSTLYAFTFYLLTGLHALHVVGGFIPLGIVLARAADRQYSSSRHDGVAFCAQYWHFLGAVWLVLLVTMMLAT